MKKIIGLIYVSVCLISFIACNIAGKEANINNLKTVTDTLKSQSKDSYTCEMDTEVHSDKPGVCPKCGMELIKANK